MHATLCLTQFAVTHDMFAEAFEYDFLLMYIYTPVRQLSLAFWSTDTQTHCHTNPRRCQRKLQLSFTIKPLNHISRLNWKEVNVGRSLI